MSDNNMPFSQSSKHLGINRLSAMIQERRLTKDFFETEEFLTTLGEVEACLYGEDSNDIWIGLSLAGRASSISKPAASLFLPMVKRRLSKALPVWCELDDGEDRYYLAKALQSAPTEQIVDQAFIELAREEAGEKARRIWGKIAFEHAPSREEFLKRLNECISLVKRKQGLTVDSLVRRLRRISNVILEDLATAEKPTGPTFGEALCNFYAGRAIKNGPEDRRLKEESADEFVQCVARIIRLNFQAASDPLVYGILTALRGWWQPSSPPRAFEITSRKVAIVGVDALHIFARQGIRNTHLRAAIVDACGKNVVDLLAKTTADSDVSLAEDVSYWFAHGREQINERSTATMEAISSKRLDEHVGRLLIAISSPDSNYRTIKAAADQISIFMPEEANILSRAANRLSQIAQWSRAIARSRNIETMGEQGEIVSYDPTVHDANEDFVVGSKVVVAVPGATRNVPGRPPVLIIKIEVKTL